MKKATTAITSNVFAKQRLKNKLKIVFMAVAAALLGLACALYYPYAKEEAGNFVILPMLLLRLALFPVFIACLSLLLITALKIAGIIPVTLSKKTKIASLSAALFILAMYITAVLAYLSFIPVFYLMDFFKLVVSARYGICALTGILLAIFM